MRKIGIIAAKSKVLSIACFLLAAISGDRNLSAQKFELAKISLGMSEQDALSAIGSGYHVYHEPVTGYPNAMYVYAANPAQRSGYSFGLVDGKVQAFEFKMLFQQGSYPLVASLRSSVEAKLWQPTEPNGSTWLSDTDGHRLVNTNQLNCGLGSNFIDTRFLLRNSAKIPRDDYEAMKGLAQPEFQVVNPKCGVIVSMVSTTYFANQALAMATFLSVKNIAVFSNLDRQARQQRQSDMNSQSRQANAVKSPF